MQVQLINNTFVQIHLIDSAFDLLAICTIAIALHCKTPEELFIPQMLSEKIFIKIYTLNISKEYTHKIFTNRVLIQGTLCYELTSTAKSEQTYSFISKLTDIVMWLQLAWGAMFWHLMQIPPWASVLLRMRFSRSRYVAQMAKSSSLLRRLSRDLLAASLFLRRLSK